MSLGLALRYRAIQCKAVLMLAAGRRHQAVSAFESMLHLRPYDRYALASCAHVQSQLKRPHDAIANLDLLVRTWPEDAAAWFNLGFLLQEIGRHEEAAAAFKRAVALDDDMDRAWYGLAMVCIHQRRFEDAASALEKNTALQPMSPYGWYRLAQVRVALGQPEMARKVIAHLCRFEPRVAAQLDQEFGLNAKVTKRSAADSHAVY